MSSLNAFDPAAAEAFLKTGPSCSAKLADLALRVTHAAVVKVDLPFRPDSFAAFVALADLTIGDDQFQVESDRLQGAERLLQDLCEKGLPAYQVPVFVHAIQATAASTTIFDASSSSSSLVVLAQKVYSDRTVVLPRTPMETQVEAVWRQQLGAVAPVSVVVSFFDLGGDSLKAGQLINAMRKKLRVQLAVADLFTAPTIEGSHYHLNETRAYHISYVYFNLPFYISFGSYLLFLHSIAPYHIDNYSDGQKGRAAADPGVSLSQADGLWTASARARKRCARQR